MGHFVDKAAGYQKMTMVGVVRRRSWLLSITVVREKKLWMLE